MYPSPDSEKTVTLLCSLALVRRHLRPLCASAVQLMTVLTAAKPISMALAPQVYLMTELLHAVELYLPSKNKNPFAKPGVQAGASGDTSCSKCHTHTQQPTGSLNGTQIEGIATMRSRACLKPRPCIALIRGCMQHCCAGLGISSRDEVVQVLVSCMPAMQRLQQDALRFLHDSGNEFLKDPWHHPTHPA